MIVMTKKYKGAVFFDADGTIVDERLGIYRATQKTQEAILRLKQNGYLTGFATGRAAFYLPDVGIDFDCIVVCNGALVKSGDDVIFHSHLDNNELDDVISYLHENGYAYCYESFDKGYYNGKNTDSMFSMLNKFNIPSDVFEKCCDHHGINIVKMMAFFETDKQFDDLQKALEGRFIVGRHHSTPSADIIKIGINKAVGIKAAIAHFGIDIRDTYAFGDDVNDLEMLAEVGCGIAMTPHSPALDAVADRYTGGVGEEGVYNALIELGLI